MENLQEKAPHPAEPRTELKITFVEKGPVPSIYANNAQVRVLPWDIRIDFGEVSEITGGEFVVERKAYITMSPTHAKAFLKVLEDDLSNYEKQFGKIWQPTQPPVTP
jgi:hypothetical protein